MVFDLPVLSKGTHIGRNTMATQRKKNSIELKNVLFVSAPDAAKRQRQIVELIREAKKTVPDSAA